MKSGYKTSEANKLSKAEKDKSDFKAAMGMGKPTPSELSGEMLFSHSFINSGAMQL